MSETLYMNERKLQRGVQRMLADPSKLWYTATGKRLQILAPGRINVYEGPDFLDMAIFLDGDVIVGHAEFHRNSSDWLAHAHDSDPLYRSVILHIVVNNDCELSAIANTLVLDASQVHTMSESSLSQEEEIPVEDIHTYALLRLLRTTAEHKALYNDCGASALLERSLQNFMAKFSKKRRRPTYSDAQLRELMSKVPSSPHARFIETLERSQTSDVISSLNLLTEAPVASEGMHMRREILINSVLPCALCTARDEARIKIFEWYWSVGSLFDYGVLGRKFPGSPQHYLWQQQGMLEILRERGSKLSAHEAMHQYGLVQSLHFYRLALEAPEMQEE